MKVLRKEYPRVRETKKSGNRYYEVDCRKVGWTGKPKFTFSKRDDALKKAKEIGELFQRDGVSGLLESSNLLDNRRLLVLETQLSIYGKSLEDAVHYYLEQLKKNPPTTASIDRLAERWIQCISKDKNKNNRKRTIQDLKSFSIQISSDFKDVLITEATRSIISDKLTKLQKKDGGELSQQTRKNYLAKLKQFFN